MGRPLPCMACARWDPKYVLFEKSHATGPVLSLLLQEKVLDASVGTLKVKLHSTLQLFAGIPTP